MRDRPREQRREQVLDAGLRLIARVGFGARALARVADQADIAKSVLYAVFRDQEPATRPGRP